MRHSQQIGTSQFKDRQIRHFILKTYPFVKVKFDGGRLLQLKKDVLSR